MGTGRRAIFSGFVIAAVVFVIAAAPPPGLAATCDELIGQTVRITGTYVPTENAYARAFVFAMLLDCKGTREVVTVQRATGTLPVCEARQPVEVVGKLIWNRALVDGHFEITDPSSVTCRPVTRAATNEPKPNGARPPVQTGPPAAAAPLRSLARTVGPSVWVGHYQDSRGAGDMTFSLVRGETTVSGTWKLRTGGGGPVTGTLEAGGRQLQLRMENIAPECPGTFEGSAEIIDTTLIATYRGKDCEGDVTGGRLELHMQ